MYIEPSGDLAFGDIFSADWLFGAYLRRDAVPLVPVTLRRGGTGWQRGAATPQRDLVLAHGLQRRAILVSDDCEAERMVEWGGRNRVLIAAIDPLPDAPGAREEKLKTRSFRRFPLPPGDGFSGGVVEFQALFGVAAEAIDPSDVDTRIARLDTDARRGLEMRWNAYSVRRGPLTHLDNGEKLARLLSGDDDAGRLARLRDREELPTEASLDVARATARALSAAWEVEGGAMNAIAEALETGLETDEALAQLLRDLERLAVEAQRAAALLRNSL